MNNDSRLIFEAYVSRQLAASDFEKNINIDFNKIPVGLQKFYRSFLKYIPDEIPGKESLQDISNALNNYRQDSETKQLPDVPAGKNERAILNDLVSFGILTKKQEELESDEPKAAEVLDDEDTDEDDGKYKGKQVDNLDKGSKIAQRLSGSQEVGKELNLGFDPGELQ